LEDEDLLRLDEIVLEYLQQERILNFRPFKLWLFKTNVAPEAITVGGTPGLGSLEEWLFGNRSHADATIPEHGVLIDVQRDRKAAVARIVAFFNNRNADWEWFTKKTDSIDPSETSSTCNPQIKYLDYDPGPYPQHITGSSSEIGKLHFYIYCQHVDEKVLLSMRPLQMSSSGSPRCS
jgi:hypothetical protein